MDLLYASEALIQLKFPSLWSIRADLLPRWDQVSIDFVFKPDSATSQVKTEEIDKLLDSLSALGNKFDKQWVRNLVYVCLIENLWSRLTRNKIAS